MNDIISIRLDNIYTAESPLSSDYIVIDTADGLSLIELKDIKLTNYNSEFIGLIDDTESNILEVSSNMENIGLIASASKRFSDFLAVYYVIKTLESEDIIIDRKYDSIIPVNHIGVNTMEQFYIDNNMDVLSDDGIVVLDSGTYKVDAIASFNVRNPGEYFSETGVSLVSAYGCNIATDIAVLDNPSRVVVISDIKYIPVERLRGKSTVTSTSQGYFYLCKPSRVGFRVSTDGNLSLGDGSLAMLSATSISDQRHYNNTSCPVQIIFERISEIDTFNLLSIDLAS